MNAASQPRQGENAALTDPQRRFLRRAGGRRGECFVGRGQGKMARELADRGFGHVYHTDAYTTKFVINKAGREALGDA